MDISIFEVIHHTPFFLEKLFFYKFNCVILIGFKSQWPCHSLLPNDLCLTIHAVLLSYQSELFTVLLRMFSKFRTGRSEALL